MRIAIGCDHRGVELKESAMRWLGAAGHVCRDFGCNSDEPVDYPDIARPVAESVARGGFDRGILICHTGIGMSMVANKVDGVRAALCHDARAAGLTRRHNDANVLCLAAGDGEAGLGAILEAFLTCDFEGGRHQRRIEKISAIEQKQARV